MFRGVIETVSGQEISGWVYSDEANLTGRTLLAFVGDSCVGSGKVDVFRQDLKDAGLGDGRFGFSFGITVEDAQSAPVVVKFEASDAILLSPDRDVVVRGEATNRVTAAEYRLRLAQLSWLSERGVVKPTDFILLRDLLTYGYCSVEVLAGEGAIGEDAMLASFKNLLSLSLQANVEVSVTRVPGNMAAAVAKLIDDGRHLPVIGLFSAGALSLKLERGSHLDEVEDSDATISAETQLRVRSPKLTLLDSRLRLTEIDADKGAKYIFAGKLSV